MGDALSPLHPDLLIATKGGVDKPEAGKPVIDGSPEALLKQVDTALTNLKTDCIDLFQLHRVDPQIPIEVSLGALEQARLAGKIRWIGLSNVNRQQLDRGRQVTSIASVQNRYNPAEIDDDAMVDYTQSCFFSDNGGATNNGSWNGPLSGVKGCLKEILRDQVRPCLTLFSHAAKSNAAKSVESLLLGSSTGKWLKSFPPGL